MKEMVYEKELFLRTTDFDQHDEIKISAVLDIFQIIAGNHAEEIGTGFDQMKCQGYYWVISKLRFDILKNPVPGKDVIIKTWPKPAGRIEFLRNNTMKNLEGEICIQCQSNWIVISEDRKIVRPEKINFNSTNYSAEKLYNESMGKKNYLIPEIYEIKSHIVQNSDIDHNGHMNNSKYGDLILNFWDMSKIGLLKSFEIYFHKEARLGDTIDTYHFIEEGYLIYIGMVNNEKCFTARIKMEERKK